MGAIIGIYGNEHECQIYFTFAQIHDSIFKKLAKSKINLAFMFITINANNCSHRLAFIALFLPVSTFSVYIHFHSQLLHQKLDFWLPKNHVLRKDLWLFLQIKSIEFKYRKLNNSS